MSCYLLARDRFALDLYLPDEDVLAASIRNGLDPSFVRGILVDSGNGSVSFEVLTRASAQGKALPDLMYWSWVPAFSSAAYEMLIEVGASDSDFLSCALVGRQEVVYLHLPNIVEDIVDVSKSVFSHFVPIDPPLPFEAVLIRPNDGFESWLPIFRTKPPMSKQVTPDVYMRGDAVNAWTNKRLTGASFKRLGQF